MHSEIAPQNEYPRATYRVPRGGYKLHESEILTETVCVVLMRDSNMKKHQQLNQKSDEAQMVPIEPQCTHMNFDGLGDMFGTFSAEIVV